MTETFAIITMLIATIGALIIIIWAMRGGKTITITKPRPRTVGKLSPLERRKEALELATKAWLYSVEHGFTFSGNQKKEVVERLEREVADLENELFGTKEEAIPKMETPKLKPVIQVEFVDDYYSPECYIITCSCGWSWRGHSVKQAEAKCAEHEWAHA